MDTNTHQSDKYIEAAVLGSMILSPEYIPMICAIVTPEMFLHHEHQVIFQAGCDQWKEHGNKDIMAIQIRQGLDVAGQLDYVGGAGYLIEVMESVPSSASWKYYCDMLKEHHSRRELLRCSHEIMTISKSDTPIDVCLSKAQDLVKRVVVEESSSESVSSLDGLTNIVGTFSESEYIPTGIYAIDNAITGIKPCEVVIIAARPAMGKTVLAVDLAINMAEQGHPVMVFSLEMRTIELKQRIVCNQTRISAHDYIHGSPTDIKIELAAKKLDELSKKPLYIDASPRLTPSLFHAKIIQYKAKYGIIVAIVDYLTLMELEYRCNSSYEKFTEIINEMKRVCREEEVALVLVCQLNRATESRTDKRPHMGDIRDSGAIEQNADVVMLLYREDHYEHTETGTAEVIIAKVRRGRPQTVVLRFHGEYTRFEDI